MTRLTEGYASRQGFRPDRWEPLQQGYRIMLDAGYLPEQIEACEDRLVEFGWVWTINTVRDWLPRFVAGKMERDDGVRRSSGIANQMAQASDEFLDALSSRIKGAGVAT